MDKTLHLFDQQRLNKLKDRSILINTSRGSVIDNNELNKVISDKKLNVVLDVWEKEPKINIELLNKVKIATPHIAGYSLEGKVNGTMILYKALCDFLKVSPTWKPQLPIIEDRITASDSNLETTLQSIFTSIYNINKDDLNLRKIAEFEVKEGEAYFDSLRRNYLLRREFSNYTLKLSNQNKKLEKLLKTFRFKIE